MAAIQFNDFVVHFGYIGIFLFFITVDQLTPIPEEITLLTIGYLSANGVFNPILAGIFSLAGFISVDIAYFFLARSGNKFIKKIFKPRDGSLTERYKEKLRMHFGKTLVVLCFIPRMRMFGPIVSGMLKLDLKKFVFFDTIGLSLFVILYISLGIFFHAGLHSVIGKLDYVRHIIFIGAAILIGVLLFVFFIRRKKRSAH
jgi:membrane protein DedA with SNARE-associated domain